MDEKKSNERRRHQRYDSEVEVYFRVNYDLKTKVAFWILNQWKNLSFDVKYTAISKNVSAEGICFYSQHKLNKNDQLFLEVYIPKKEKPIPMIGEVRWCQPFSKEDKEEHRFYTGIKLLKVYDKIVAPTIYFDQTYQVIWSIVLESIFGSFRQLAQGK